MSTATSIRVFCETLVKELEKEQRYAANKIISRKKNWPQQYWYNSWIQLPWICLTGGAELSDSPTEDLVGMTRISFQYRLGCFLSLATQCSLSEAQNAFLIKTRNCQKKALGGFLSLG